MILEDYIKKQMEWSQKTFGPGVRDAGLIDHIKKELKEIEDQPGDIMEWVDVIILALDGAWRNGFSPLKISMALQAKQWENIDRQWPDWRTAEPGKAIEHIRVYGCGCGCDPKFGHAPSCMYDNYDEIQPKETK